jgi:hypothetical protein
MLRVAEHTIASLSDCFFKEQLGPDEVSACTSNTMAQLPRELLVSGCETQTAVLGMTSVISFLCHYVGNFFQWILLTEDEDDRSIGVYIFSFCVLCEIFLFVSGLEKTARSNSGF